jgi:hypothetical protein
MLKLKGKILTVREVGDLGSFYYFKKQSTYLAKECLSFIKGKKESKEMKLKDLENSAVVETRGKERFIKVGNTFLNVKMNGAFLAVDQYNEDLLKERSIFIPEEVDREHDIMKVANKKAYYPYKNANIVAALKGEWTWVREEKPAEEKPILDEGEKKYLSALIAPFKDRVISIKKLSIKTYCTNLEWLIIRCKSNFESRNYEEIELPSFEKGSMYAGVEEYRAYSLEELGLIKGE